MEGYAESLGRHAKSCGLLSKSFSMARRWACILKRLRLSSRRWFSKCEKYSVAVDESRFQTITSSALLGAQQCAHGPFKTVWAFPQETLPSCKSNGQGYFYCSQDWAGGRRLPPSTTPGGGAGQHGANLFSSVARI